MKNILFLCITLISYSLQAHNDISCRPHDVNGRAREKTVSLKDLTLYIHLHEKESKVAGRAVYKYTYLRPEIDTLFLDAIQFQVKSLKINNNPVDFKTDSAGITIILPKNKSKENTLDIEYECFPSRGIYFINWNNPDPLAKKQIWTQGQGIDNRHWIPGFDDVANLLFCKTHITFNKNYPLVSNGDLIKVVKNADSTSKTWSYEMKKPHALYLIMIAGGDYKFKKQKSKNGVILEQYYYPELENEFEATYAKSEEMMDWFEKEIGIDYAWGKIYRNVPTQDFLFGAMENTTSTIFTDFMHVDKRSAVERDYMGVNAHELAHQWFGDLITERNPTHHWLHESFATHYSKWFLYHTFGKDKYDQIRKGERDGAFNASRYNDFPVAHSQGGSARHYPKGSYVLDMLRHELGNENYRKVIQIYLDKYKHGNVETNNLYESIYEVLGRNLDWFFDQWVFKGGEPVLQINRTIDKNKVKLNIYQVHKKNDVIKNFRLPLDIHIQYSNKEEEIKSYTITKDSTEINFELNRNDISLITVDPDAKLLRKIGYESDLETEFNILKTSPYSMARIEAVERLKSMDWALKSDVFEAWFSQEKNTLVKTEILEHLPKENTDAKAWSIIKMGMQDANHLVRRFAMNGIHTANDSIKPLLIAAQSDTSYINIEVATKKLLKLYPKESSKWLEAISKLSGINRNLELLYWSEILTKSKEDKQSENFKNAKKRLTYLASETFNFRIRTEAMDVLIAEKEISESLINSMIQGSLYFHPQMRNRSITYLNHLKKEFPDAFKTVFEKYPFKSEKDKNLVLERIK